MLALPLPPSLAPLDPLEEEAAALDDPFPDFELGLFLLAAFKLPLPLDADLEPETADCEPLAPLVVVVEAFDDFP